MLTSPSTAPATPGMRVAGSGGRISAQSLPGRRRSGRRRERRRHGAVGELAISIKETKIAEGLGLGNNFLATRDSKCSPEVRRPLALERKAFSLMGWRNARHAACRACRGVASSRASASRTARAGDPPRAPAGIHRIAHNGMADVLQMDPDLVGAAGMQLQPEELGHDEPGNDRCVGPGRAAVGLHAHALAVARVPGHRRPRWRAGSRRDGPRPGRHRSASPGARPVPRSAADARHRSWPPA